MVTGGGRGLGRAEALALAGAGAAVVVNDPGYGIGDVSVDPTVAEAVATEIARAGGSAVADSSDCSDWAGAAAIVDTAEQAFGRLDIVVNNAGILREAMSFNLTEDAFDDVVRVHLRGHVAMSRHAGAYWRAEAKAGRGDAARSLINTTSDSGLFGQAGILGYSVSKAAIAGLTIVLARELAPYGVRVNAIAPSAFRTRLLPSSFTAEATSGWDPLDPANVGPAVVWLASDRSRITGQVLWVSGDSVEVYEGWRPRCRVAASGRNLDESELDELATLAGVEPPPPVPPQGQAHWGATATIRRAAIG